MALKETKQEEIHVLMVTLPAQGHINPMLRLGKRLLDKGVHVSLATTLFGGHRMLKASSITSITGPNFISGIPILFFSDGISLDYDRSGNLNYYMETLAKTGPVNLSNLIKDYYHDTGKKLSCIINNPFVPWVIDAALENQIPCAMHWIQPCSLYAIYYRFYNKLNQFPTLENPDISVELPGLPLLQTQDLPSFVLPSNPFGCFTKMFSDIFQNMKRYKWVLANSFLELEKEAIESMAELCPIRPVGPLVPPSLLGKEHQSDVVDAGISMWKADKASLEWLNNQLPASVIYPTNAKLIVDVFKVGLRLNPSHPDGENVFVKEELEKCITEILCGPKSEELKKNALKLKQAAHEAVSSGGSSDRNIQLFVDEISGN
ncbi:UDP-glucuronosyl/UDP-glucosyltransferase [Corchorus olitorius]|uniref:UDP-glucuronosyl/UDP-glucosyltransferase n=1 Tax=Corchorus olitorius TaxID=93759 RepID=A0A1R3GZ48_9ROSI|nr:UDP-glucuronosyl/UDP-glucosyltransferase [Corchorus olitorius]